MDQSPLVMEEIDAGTELVKRFDLLRPVEVAFWLRVSDDDRFLYIASPQVDDTNLEFAYDDVIKLTKSDDHYVDPFRVKLVGVNHPLAVAASEINRKFPGRMATRLRNTPFGGIFAEDIYIYPPLVPEPAH